MALKTLIFQARLANAHVQLYCADEYIHMRISMGNAHLSHFYGNQSFYPPLQYNYQSKRAICSFNLKAGLFLPYCALHFLPLINIRVNRLCISIA